MVRRLVVHAGFHKTGTTTIQNTLAAHADTLRDHAHIVLRNDMVGLCEAARAYSTSRSEFDLGLVRYEAALLAESWSADTVLISSEDLSGHMPGRHGLAAYNAAPLAATMTEGWHAALPDVQVDWVYTTRAAAPWLASCHVQHLRAVRMTMDAQDYAAQFAGSADLDGVVNSIRGEVTGADVHILALEDHGGNLVAPLLALAHVPDPVQARVTPLPPANTSPSAARIKAMLDLNRSDIPDADWRAAQNALNRQDI